MEGELRLFQKFFRCQKVPSHIILIYSEEWQTNAYAIDDLLHPQNPISTDFSETTPVSVLAGAWGSRIFLFNNLQSCRISLS